MLQPRNSPIVKMQQEQQQFKARLYSLYEEVVQEHGLTHNQRQEVLSTLEKFWQDKAKHIQAAAEQCRPQARLSNTQVTPSYLLQSPVYRPLSPAPADVELQQLEEQVHKASQEAAALRHSVPDKLKEIYSGELAQLRPKLVALHPKDVGAGDGDGGQENLAEDRDAPLQYSPDPQHLKEKLADAGSKLPILRARLEEAGDRVQRVFAVLSSEMNRPPPNTVERALLGKTPGKGAGVGYGQACEEALENGMVSTRRKLGDDIEPVPLVMPEETA